MSDPHLCRSVPARSDAPSVEFLSVQAQPTSKEADIPQHPSVRIDGAQREHGDIYRVLMAVFLGVGPSLMLCARIHTPRTEKCVRLQARVAHAGPQRWLKLSKPSMPSTMAITKALLTLFVPLAQALTVVWNLTLVFCLVTSLMLGRPSTSKNEALMVLDVMLMSTSVLLQGPFVTSL